MPAGSMAKEIENDRNRAGNFGMRGASLVIADEPVLAVKGSALWRHQRAGLPI